MNKEAIRATAVCRWDEKGKYFIVQSPLYDVLIGAAPTKAEAWNIFDDFLDDAYTSYLEGRLGGMYAKRGRPRKNRIGIHCEVKSESKEDLRKLSAEFGCSQGETIDYLTAFFQAARTYKTGENIASITGYTSKLSRQIPAKTRKLSRKSDKKGEVSGSPKYSAVDPSR